MVISCSYNSNLDSLFFSKYDIFLLKDTVYAIEIIENNVWYVAYIWIMRQNGHEE